MLNPSFEHNGITFNRVAAPPPMGPLASHVFALVGTAPDADASLAKDTPHRIDTLAKLAQLDTTGNERGTLWRIIDFVWKVANVPFYVVIVPEGANAAETKANIIGQHKATGEITGMKALTSCPEQISHIHAPGDKDVVDALVAMATKLDALVVVDGPNTTDAGAVAFSSSLGSDKAYDSVYCVDTNPSVYSVKAKGDVQISAAAVSLACFARVKAWESPAAEGAVPINGTARVVDYSISDKSTPAGLLLKNGVSFFARTNLGGFNLIGNRSVTGKFINKIGLELALIKKLKQTSQRGMGKNLDKDFIDSELEKLNAWLSSQVAEGALIGAKVYLHPVLNNVESYRNGTWHIAIKHGAYSPNEHTVYHLSEDLSIIQKFVEGLK